jgi:hypothetical protein
LPGSKTSHYPPNGQGIQASELREAKDHHVTEPIVHGYYQSTHAKAGFHEGSMPATGLHRDGDFRVQHLGLEHFILGKALPCIDGTVSVQSLPQEIFSTTILQNMMVDQNDSPQDSIDIESGMAYYSDVTYRRNEGPLRHIPSQMTCTLPLAAVAAPNFDYEAFQKLWMEVPPHPDLIKMVPWLTSPCLAEQLLHHVPNCPPGPVSRDPTFDLSPLLSAGIIEELQASSLFSSRVFRVPKSDDETSRFIFDGRCFDDIFRAAIGPPPDLPLPLITEVIDTILSGWSVISSNDAKSMFFQFSIDRSLSRFFEFRVCPGRRGRFRRLCLRALPMGVCFAPTWAQHVSSFLASIVRHRCRHIKFAIIVWIDNFIILSHSEADDREVRRVFDEVVASVNLKFKGWTGGLSRLEALGMSFDLEARTARPTAQKNYQTCRFN